MANDKPRLIDASGLSRYHEKMTAYVSEELAAKQDVISAEGDASYISLDISADSSLTATAKIISINDASLDNTGLVDAYDARRYMDEHCGSISVIDDLDTEDSSNALSANQGFELNKRLEKLENAPSNTEEFKKNTLMFYRKLGEVNSELKPYCDAFRASMLGMEDFAALGTGLFIHWGVYAVPAGNYTGPKQTGSTITATSTNYNTEWIMRDLGIPRDVYKAYQDQFTAANWDPNAICDAAVAAGMGYIVITIKHHDGFSLAPTEHGSWDVKTSAARDTIIDELKEACDSHGLKFGIYYSQYWDWMAEGGFGLEVASRKGGYWNGSSADQWTSDQHIAYCNEAALQINELVEKYKPYILWYDPGKAYASNYVNIFIDAEDNKYPHIITNDRLDYARSRGDYGTGERTIYLRNLKYGEACFTMNNTWGYSDNNESSYYTIEKVFKEFMLYSIMYGQNCLMNIGPKADGTIPAKQLECLDAMRSFIETYGSFKGYTRTCVDSLPKWGYMIKVPGNKIMCYVITKGNPATQNVVIDNISLHHLTSVDILTPGTGASYSIGEKSVTVSNLALDQTTKVGVIRLNYSSDPLVIDANHLDAGSILPSRTFLMKSNLTYDFTNLIYNFKPAASTVTSTAIIFDGEDGDYNITPSFESDAEDNKLTVTITDIDSSTAQVVEFPDASSSSETAVSLNEGEKYMISVKVTGTSSSSSSYKFKGLTFTKKVVIIHPESVSLDQSEVSVEVEGTAQLAATVLPADATDKSVTWTSSDTNVATVEDGLVIGVSAGESVITVHTVDGDKTASCTVTVEVAPEEVIHITDISLDPSTLMLTIGETGTITPTITPGNATYQTLSWSSSDTTKVSVEGGVVSAIGVGSAVVTARGVYDDDKYATAVVTVEGVSVESISLDSSVMNLVPGFGQQLTATVLPDTATIKDVTWSSSDPLLATVDSSGYVFAKSAGSVQITATTVDGGFIATCDLTVSAETYDYLFEALRMDGVDGQGDDTGIKLFSDEMQEWTLFGYVHDSINKYRNGTTSTIDTNETLYQCVVDASPWSGLRVDANSNVSKALDVHVPMRFRFMAGTDNYVNATTGELMSSSTVETVTAPKHPLCITRSGNTYKFTSDGISWTEFSGLNTTQLARLKNCVLTVGFDYVRSGGATTTTTYRHLKTEEPCCVAFKTLYEYPFYTLYHKYDSTIHVACADIVIDTDDITLNPGDTLQLNPTLSPAHCTSVIVYESSDPTNVSVSSNGLLTYVSTGEADITISCDSVTKTIHVVCSSDTPMHDVTFDLDGVSVSPSDITEIQDGSQMTATLAPVDADGTVVGNVQVTMGGVDVTSSVYDESTLTIHIESVTDDVEVTAEATDKLIVTFTMDSPISIDGVQYSDGDELSVISSDKIKWLNSIIS